jgi:hypothetical protein
VTAQGLHDSVDVVVDGVPTLELPVVPASAVPADGASPAGVVPPGTPPSMVLLPPSRWSTWVAGVGAAAAAGVARFDAVAADASVAARRARSTAVRQAGVAGLATWHGLVALLAGALTLVFGTLTWVLRHFHRFLRLAVVIGMVVVVVRAVPWGRVGDAADGVVRRVQGWSTTTTTTSTTTTTEDPNQYDAMVPYDEWPDSSGEFDRSEDSYDVPTTTEDPYVYGDTSSRGAGGQRVETVRPGQATYRSPTSTSPENCPC